MTQEEKELLLKDLCARLHCGVEVYYTETIPISTLKTINSENGTCIVYDHSEWYKHIKLPIEVIKPYLRPMSSMTEEEKNKINTLLDIIESPSNVTDETGRIIDYSYDCIELIDFYNSRYLDYRGLIPKGLALEAPEDMYKKKHKD